MDNTTIREELLHDISEARAIISSPNPLHENRNEDRVIRTIWNRVLNKLLTKLDSIERSSR